VFVSLEDETKRNHGFIVNPVVGPESITGDMHCVDFEFLFNNTFFIRVHKNERRQYDEDTSRDNFPYSISPGNHDLS
jgi:hypothetical protein